MVGRSPYLNAVHLVAPADTTGTIVTARIVSAETNSLGAERVAVGEASAKPPRARGPRSHVNESEGAVNASAVIMQYQWP